MRLRNIKGSREHIAESQYVISEPEVLKGRWNSYFQNENPIHVEIGTGKGRFLIDMAAKNPQINFVGIEKYSSVLIRAIERQEEELLPNLIFLRFEAEMIASIFAKDEVDRIYLNFSDPWPKDRHAKRRLTSKTFFQRYTQILRKEGLVIFKTDNQMLFDFSLEQVKEANWVLENFTRDLHDSEYREGNVMTEYEERFLNEGKPICRLIACQIEC